MRSVLDLSVDASQVYKEFNQVFDAIEKLNKPFDDLGKAMQTMFNDGADDINAMLNTFLIYQTRIKDLQVEQGRLNTELKRISEADVAIKSISSELKEAQRELKSLKKASEGGALDEKQLEENAKAIEEAVERIKELKDGLIKAEQANVTFVNTRTALNDIKTEIGELRDDMKSPLTGDFKMPNIKEDLKAVGADLKSMPKTVLDIDVKTDAKQAEGEVLDLAKELKKASMLGIETDVEIDTEDAKKELDKLNKNLKKADKGIEIDVDADTKSAVKDVKKLEKALEDADDAADDLGESMQKGFNTERLKDAASELAGGGNLIETGLNTVIGALPPQIGLAAGALIGLGKQIKATADEAFKIQSLVSKLVPAGEVDKASQGVLSIAKTFGVEQEKIILAANAGAKNAGISFDEALSKLSLGLANVGDKDEFLDTMKEYSSATVQSGKDLDELIKISVTGQKEGIYADKANDSLKELKIRMAETAVFEKRVAENFGAANAKRLHGITDEIDKRDELLKLIKSAPEKEQAFLLGEFGGGALEDAGIRAVDVLLKAREATLSYTDAQKSTMEANDFLARSMVELSNEFGDAGTNMDNLGTIAEGVGNVAFITIVKYGREVLETLKAIAKPITDLVDKLTQGKTQSDKFGMAMQYLSAYVKIVTIPMRVTAEIIGGLVSLLINTTKGFWSLTGAMDAVGKSSFSLQTVLDFMTVLPDYVIGAAKYIAAIFEGLGENIALALIGKDTDFSGIFDGAKDAYDLYLIEQRVARKGAAERQAAEDAKEAKKAARLKSQQDAEAARAATKAAYDARIAELDRQRQAEEKELADARRDNTISEEEYQNDLRDINEKYAEQKIGVAKKYGQVTEQLALDHSKILLDNDKAQYDQQIKLLDDYLKVANAELKDARQKDLITERDFNVQSLVLLQKVLKEKIELGKAQGIDTSELENQLSESFTNINQIITDSSNALKEKEKTLVTEREDYAKEIASSEAKGIEDRLKVIERGLSEESTTLRQKQALISERSELEAKGFEMQKLAVERQLGFQLKQIDEESSATKKRRATLQKNILEAQEEGAIDRVRVLQNELDLVLKEEESGNIKRAKANLDAQDALNEIGNKEIENTENRNKERKKLLNEGIESYLKFTDSLLESTDKFLGYFNETPEIALFKGLTKQLQSSIGEMQKAMEDGSVSGMEAVNIAGNAALGIVGAMQDGLDASIAATDRSIAATEENIDRIKEGLKEGGEASMEFSATQLAAEEERLAKLQEQREADLEKQKNLAIIEMGIKTALAVVNVFATTPPPYSFILAGLTVAAFVASLALAKQAGQAAVAERGGYMSERGFLAPGTKSIRGRRHSQGGELVEMESGEYVFSRTHSKQFEPLFKAIHDGKVNSLSDIVLDKKYLVMVQKDNQMQERLLSKLDRVINLFQKREPTVITVDSEGILAKGDVMLKRKERLARNGYEKK